MGEEINIGNESSLQNNWDVGSVEQLDWIWLSETSHLSGTKTKLNTETLLKIINIRLKMKNEAKELSDSLNGYLNTYKSLMASSLKSIDYFKTLESSQKCTNEGCLI